MYRELAGPGPGREDGIVGVHHYHFRRAFLAPHEAPWSYGGSTGAQSGKWRWPSGFKGFDGVAEKATDCGKITTSASPPPSRPRQQESHAAR